MGGVVQLGKALEHLGDPLPIKDATTKPQPHTGKKKKLAIGQKEDDHSAYGFELTMKNSPIQCTQEITILLFEIIL